MGHGVVIQNHIVVLVRNTGASCGHPHKSYDCLDPSRLWSHLRKVIKHVVKLIKNEQSCGRTHNNLVSREHLQNNLLSVVAQGAPSRFVFLVVSATTLLCKYPQNSCVYVVSHSPVGSNSAVSVRNDRQRISAKFPVAPTAHCAAGDAPSPTGQLLPQRLPKAQWPFAQAPRTLPTGYDLEVPGNAHSLYFS